MADPTISDAASPDAPAPTSGLSRRGLLRAGGLGIAGAALLAACSDGSSGGGISGTPASSTEVPATVPVTKPQEPALAADLVELRTAQSVELLAASLYTKYGAKLTDAEWKTTAARFGADHEAAASAYAEAAKPTKASSQPNEYLVENFVGPAEESLTDDRAILDFFASLESMIAANAINATGIYTSATWRQKSMSFGAASARRVTVLGNGGEGVVPDAALFPLTDLMPTDAYLTPEAKATS